MLSQLSLLAIRGYQRHLSPRKGYACAYRMAHGGTGCSGFAKAAIAESGLIAALPLIRARFQACRTAALSLHAKDDQKQRRKRDACDPSGCDCGTLFHLNLCRGSRGADTTPDGCDCTPDGCSL